MSTPTEKDVYDLFREELLEAVDVTEEQAENITTWLSSEGFIDYDFLKEVYLYNFEDE